MFCYYCGIEIDEKLTEKKDGNGIIYCPNCGAKLIHPPLCPSSVSPSDKIVDFGKPKSLKEKPERIWFFR